MGGQSVRSLCRAVVQTAFLFRHGVNIFKALVDFVQGGVLIGFEDEPEDVVELPVSENDPYGFVAKLAEYD